MGSMPQPLTQVAPADARALVLAACGLGPEAREAAWASALLAMPMAAGSLGAWVVRYLAVKLGGRSKHTVAARGRDLTAFCRWFHSTLGHLEIGGWMPAHSHQYLQHLRDRQLAPASVNRALWSLKHFAGWVVTQPGSAFHAWGHPVADAREIRVDEAPCRKLTPSEAERLLAAAQRRVDAERVHPLQRPARDLALVGTLLFTGLRVSELTGLRRAQYRGGDLHQVSRKAAVHSRQVLLNGRARALLDAYLGSEWGLDVDEAALPTAPLFAAAGSGRPLDRARVGRIVADLARRATPAGEPPWHVHPHQLRHTFGARYRQVSGSDTETAQALGHQSLKYVGRYVRQSSEERRQLLDRMFEAEPPSSRDADAVHLAGSDKSAR